jgi:hypothetical protein
MTEITSTDYATNIYTYVESTTGRQVVKAVTNYAGKSVYAFAKCDPEDTFDLGFGTALALKRLDFKITKLRAASVKAYAKQCQMNIDFLDREKRRAKKALEKATVFYGDLLVEAQQHETELAALLANV